MEKINFNKSVFTVVRDGEGEYYIEENILADRVMESAEECTSPKGVMPRLHTVGTSLMWWEVNGHERLIETFGTEEEAEQEWYNRTYEHDYIDSDLFFNDYDTELDAIIAIADSLELSHEEAEAIIDARENELREFIRDTTDRKAERLEREYGNALTAGHVTKNLIRAYDDIKYGSSYFHGTQRIKVDTLSARMSNFFEIEDYIIKNR